MTARTAARPGATLSAAQEIRRLRGQLAAALAGRARFARMLSMAIDLAAPDPRDERLRQLEHAETWAAGYEAGERAGFDRACAGYKRAQLGAVADLETYLARWDGGPRERFGDPRPADHGPWTPADVAALLPGAGA